MARPGHLRTQAYRSLFSQACDHGFQFSSMSGRPIIQTLKSPPGSLLSDFLELVGPYSVKLVANLSRQVNSTSSLRRTSTPVSLAVSTAHVVESTDVSAFPAEVFEVKTSVRRATSCSSGNGSIPSSRREGDCS